MPQGNSLPKTPNVRLRLTTLGGAVLVCESPEAAEQTLLRPGKALALVVYLAASPQRTASRDHLIDLLWANLEPDIARRAFRQAVWFIRHRVGDEILLGRNDDLALAEAVRCDRGEFLDAVESGELERAVELYQGVFMPGFAAPGGAEFEHWADLERDRLRRAFLRAAEAVVRRDLSRGRWHEAERLARSMRDADPMRESMSRLLIECHLSADDPVGAGIEADALEQLLAVEQREPEPATRALLTLVRRTALENPEAAKGRTLVAELVGREGEFGHILAAWEHARRSDGRHVRITAAAGLGKTRLLNDVHARLRATGARTVYIRANPGERHIPYVFAAHLAAGLATLPGAAALSPAAAGTLVGLNPSLLSRYPTAARRTVRGEEALRHRVLALVELLEDVADEGPVALLIDDVHWIDAPSRQLLHGLVDEVAQSRVLVVTTARPVPDQNVETSTTLHITLPSLSTSDVGALLGGLGALPQEAWANTLPERLHAATGGSPLLVLETLQLALERGYLVLATDGWSCPDPSGLAAQLEAGSALRHRIEQLEPQERSLLLLLAVAGTPVPVDLVARAGDRSWESAAAVLEALEGRGVVMRDGVAWLPAHDEIAAHTLELSTEDALRTAHSALGGALARDAGEDTQQLMRAGRHLEAGAATRELEGVYCRLVVASRKRGERRRPADLAVDVLGEEPAPAHVRRLTASLPLYIRFGLTTGRRVAAAAVAVLAALTAGVAVLLTPNPPPPDAVLIAISHTEDGDGTAYSVPIYRDQWEALSPLDIRAQGKPRPELLTLAHQSALTFGPDGSTWVYQRTVSDSGELELFLVGENGMEERLTTSPGDDGQPSWAPDGRSLVFGTVRWNPRHRQDLAVLDLETGRLRPLTRNDHSDLYPSWSPDGTRVAFVRGFLEMRPPEICWITVDARLERCTLIHGYVPTGISGWYDHRQVLVVVDSAAQRMLARVDLGSQTVRVVDRLCPTQVVSPDGRWGTCTREDPASRALAWYVFPLDRPDQARRVEFGSIASEDFFLLWRSAGAPSRYLERVEIVRPAVPIPLDATHRLRVRGFDAAGHASDIPVLAWWSADTAIAAVDSAGTLEPKRVGTVTVHVSAGGWRHDSVRVTIRPPGYATVLEEHWTGNLSSNWVPFGVPRPVLTTGPDGVPAFWHRGDSTYHSGVYSTRAFAATRGLGMEALVSTPIDELQWQSVSISLNSQLDSAALADWDHRTGSPPSATTAGSDVCSMRYPRSDGFVERQRVGLGAGGSNGLVLAEPWLRSGRWYTVRFQIFPDGRCGFAVDGQPLWRSDSPVSVDRLYRVRLQGKSVRTRILVGPLSVWEGVRGDVDWDLLERR